MTKKIKIINIVGARPNFMKIAPLMDEFKKRQDKFDALLLHTGQHYDEKMSKVFFEDLSIPKPHINLEIGSGSHGEQTGRIMIDFEKVCLKEKPDLVLVVGDVNSTLACSIVAKKLNIKVAHVEAGLRSGDMEMPEEINRVVTDSITDYFFTTSVDADEHLIREGHGKEKIFFTGNVMIDTLMHHREKAKKCETAKNLSLSEKEYFVMTLHRPSNVDSKENLKGISEAIYEVSKKMPVLFPIHPRTLKNVKEFGLQNLYKKHEKGKKIEGPGIWMVEPFGYLEFLSFMDTSIGVLTDSGGMQEETTVLGVPCLTIRENTERPVTVTEGTNTLIGLDFEKIKSEAQKIIDGNGKAGRVPKFWDGSASKRIIDVLEEKLRSSNK